MPESSEQKQRRETRERAERIESRRGQFNRHMEKQGLSAEERARELRKLDETVAAMRAESER